MLSELSQKELDQLATHDEYDLESYKFQVLNYDIEVKDALIAEALTSLTKRKRDVILLSYFMGMSDAEIARKMKLVRSTVNEHRKRSLEILRRKKQMSQKCEFQYNLLPFETIKEATQGDVDAVEEVLKHYDGYINNLSRRKMYDEYGQIHYCVDETLKRRLQTKLLIKTLNFKIGN